MRKLLFLSSILFSLLLIGCQKEITTQDTSAPKLLSVLMKSGDSSTRINLNYDNQNRLSGYSLTIGQRIYKKSDLLYDTQGRLTGYSDTMSNGLRTTYSFSYDQNGRILQKMATYSNYSGSALPFRKTYAYDVQGRLIADTIFSYWSNDIAEYKTYKYDQNDNIIEKTLFNKITGSLQPESTVKMTYDSKVNPFHSIGMVWHYLTSDFFVDGFNFSRNNVVTEDYQNGSIVSYTYQYNNLNLPTKYVSIENTDPVEIIREFSY